MASLLLSTAGSALGGAVGGPLGGFLGGRIGKLVGSFADSRIMGGSKRHREGPRLADLSVQTSTYGRMIPILYGTVRIAGNIIWSRPIKETGTTTTSSSGGAGGKGGGGRVTQSTTTYSYSVSMAIAVCEGPVTEILRIWADAKQLDLSQGTYRIYKGDEDQLPDSFIESIEGIGSTPAYRAMAYVVVEDFPLADFGNRIPNFTFEVKKKILYPDYGGQAVEEMIESVIMIPGSGEFVYDTQDQSKIPGELVSGNWVQKGNQERINTHTPLGQTNAMVSLDQMEETLPNVEWVGVVVTWFGDSLDAGTCVIKPGVEYQTGAITSPETWTVGSFTRGTARQITIVDGFPRYGGTPDDQSLLRYLTELKNRGYNIMFYPMFFMDVTDKPWRGHVTGSAADVASFFTKPNGYNAFINHYATLVASYVDAFVIGSELIGLTGVTDTPGNYPAVNALVSLAASVKAAVGGGVKVTYAADWSEYHHTTGGWYNMDPLWASANIDVVGIDAYFPLTDVPQNGYDIQEVIDGWTQGEGYDWYYTDPGRTTQAALAPAYAWKNIEWWWNHTHTNPDASGTGWTAHMKPIWFTEYGFPSVDGSSNQPNVFYDPDSSDGALPRFSRGRVDTRAQRVGLAGTEAKWQGSTMIERRFVWTWDARPFPYWPDLLSVWTDGGLWAYGHWIQGKLGLSGLAAIVADLCQRAGLEGSDYNVSRLNEPVEGFVLSDLQSARDSIEQLQTAFFFDSVESDNVLKFVPRGQSEVVSIPETDLIPREDGDARELLAVTRDQEIELPQRVQVTYINRTANYQTGTQISQRMVTESRDLLPLHLPVVFSDQGAKIIADKHLFLSWTGRTRFACDLPIEYATLEPTDVIEVTEEGVTHKLRITATQMASPSIVRIQGMAEDVASYDFYTAPGETPGVATANTPIVTTRLELLDLPAFPTDLSDKGVIRGAALGLEPGWRGSIVYRSADGGANYDRWADMLTPCVVGSASSILATGPTCIFDEVNSVTVILAGDGTLASASELSVLNGSNAALLGSEIIQFKTATLVEPGKYTLSGLLRGRLGTDHALATHALGERFVLLDERLTKEILPLSSIGLLRVYKPVSIGGTLGSTTAQNFTYTGIALKPLSPVSIAGARDGSSNLTITWIRRTRLSGAWLDGADVPLNEAAEQYEIDIMNGMTVVRTITATTPTASYTAAQQTTDFGSPQASVTVNIYQLSAAVGRGYAGNKAI